MTFLDRLGRVEFFAIVPAGLVMLGVVFVWAMANAPENTQHFLAELDKRPFLAPILLIAVAYLLGSLLRILHADTADIEANFWPKDDGKATVLQLA